MKINRVSHLFFGMLLVSAASCALYVPQAYAGDYNSDSVLMAPPTQDGFQVAQAGNASTDDAMSTAAPNQSAPAGIPTRPPFSKTNNKDKTFPTVIPAEKPAVPVATDATKKPPVDYAADSVDYDQANKVVTLHGHVELSQEGRKMDADKVVYNLKDDIATAEGNVVIRDPNGDVHHAESVELSDKMRKGLVEHMFTTLADGSRIWAAKGIKESEDRYKLEDAIYTACVACADDPDKRPPWRLHAKEAELRKDEHRVVYHNAWLDMGGVPVLYTPYFSHPDGSITQKSGFLTPNFGFNSNLGFFFAQPYYWAISPSTDTTFTMMPTTQQGPLLRNEFRKRWDNAYITTDSSVTNSSRKDSSGALVVDEGDHLRGHLFANGGWDINDKWRAGMNLKLASDEQYLRQYGFSDESYLENTVFAERFDDRDYATVKAIAFQDLRVTSTDQPNILPYGEMDMLGDPNALLGGRWELNSSILSLARDGNGQDEWRASSRASWKRQDVAPIGLVLQSEVGARVDAYETTDRLAHALNPAVSENNQQGRFFPNAQITAGYPVKRDFQTYQVRVEPVASLYLAPNINNNNSIPNEDSQDVQLDAANLLEGNRFPGLDRIEDNSHVAYGLKSGLYNYTGGRLTSFLGQSYNFDNSSNPFPAGSGLETRSSDYVGAVSASFDEGRHDVSYRFQVDSDSMSAQRHELYALTNWGPVEVDGYYLYAAGAPGTAYADDRQQIKLGSSVQLTDNWTVRGDAVYDLSDRNAERGLRRSTFTLNYTQECYNVALTADRYLADETSGVQDTTVMFRVGLKNLGEYTSKAVNLAGADTAE